MFKGLYLNKIHMHTNDYCNVRLARNVKVQGFFICHIIVIQGIIRSEM